MPTLNEAINLRGRLERWDAHQQILRLFHRGWPEPIETGVPNEWAKAEAIHRNYRILGDK